MAAWTVLALLAAMGTAASCGGPEGDLIRRMDRSLTIASRFLISRQSKDGAWRSEIYGGMRDGATLTPPVLKSLFFIPDPDGAARTAFRKGVRYLVSWVGEDGRIRDDGAALSFPVYTAALAGVVVDLESHNALHTRARSAWFRHLLRYRLDRSLGWGPEDSAFGGWGYAVTIPRKPESGDSPYEANLSATIFSVGALRHAQVAPDDPVYGEILRFVLRCQNLPDKPEDADARFDDGGFFFTPSDPPRNKGGVAGTDRFGRERYNSYGSATADGLRALIRCGLSRHDPRVQAARGWLEKHFSAESNPGKFAPDREVLRDATYYYYCWSVAHALVALGPGESPGARWLAPLASELILRQRPDGSWANPFTDAKEDDPVIATALASAALTLCRGLLLGRSFTGALSPQ